MREKIKDVIQFTIALAVVGLFLHFTGIGCPIKYVTGISCPGCGMTRAWISVFFLKFDEAFAYHPLFWMIPCGVIIYLFKKKIPNMMYQLSMCAAIFMLLAVYIYRLLSPSGDVVTIAIEDGMLYRYLCSVLRWIKIM